MISNNQNHRRGVCHGFGSFEKKLSSFKTEKGFLTKVSDDLLIEVLNAWENWTRTSKDFYKGIGSNQRKMARMIGKAKQLKTDGHSLPSSQFQEVSIDGVTATDKL